MLQICKRNTHIVDVNQYNSSALLIVFMNNIMGVVRKGKLCFNTPYGQTELRPWYSTRMGPAMNNGNMGVTTGTRLAYPWLFTVILLRHQPRAQDTTIRHANANKRLTPAKVTVNSDIGRTANTTTPTTKKHTPMIPSIGPRMHTEREADGCPARIGVHCWTYIHNTNAIQ